MFEQKRDESLNPRHKKPKGKKFEFERPIRLAKIKKALESNAEAELKLRQERLNKRKLAGIDFMFQKGLPSFMKLDKKQAAQQDEAKATETREFEALYGDERSKKPKYS